MLTIFTMTGVGPAEWAEWYGSGDGGAEAIASSEVFVCEPIKGYPDCIVLASNIDHEGAKGLAMATLNETGAVGCSSVLAEQIHPRSTERALSLADLAPNKSGHIYLACLNVDREVESRFNEWYNSRHIPMVETAGLLDGIRFRASSAFHKYLALYRMAHEGVLESEEIARVRGFEEFETHVHDLTRQVLRVA